MTKAQKVDYKNCWEVPAKSKETEKIKHGCQRDNETGAPNGKNGSNA